MCVHGNVLVCIGNIHVRLCMYACIQIHDWGAFTLEQFVREMEQKQTSDNIQVTKIIHLPLCTCTALVFSPYVKRIV